LLVGEDAFDFAELLTAEKVCLRTVAVLVVRTLVTTIGVRATENECIRPKPPDLARASLERMTSVAAPIARVESILAYVVMIDLPDPTRAPIALQ
jgi:hypothetical protein